MILAARAGLATLRQPTSTTLLERKLLAALVIAITAAWAVLALTSAGGALTGGASASHSARPGPATMAAMPGMSAPSKGSAALPFFAGAAATWALMIVAMMLPAALPAASYAGARSLRRRRVRAMTEFVIGYLSVWLLAGVAILALAFALGSGRVVLLTALAVAAAWQATTFKNQALRDCHRSTPLPPSGWAADRASATFGLRNGWACVRSCWALMLVMSVVVETPLLWMAGVALITSAEKSSQRPQHARRCVGAALGAMAVGSAALGWM